jgi:DUF4097 and DUF4098 domain-containing protein YvlB
MISERFETPGPVAVEVRCAEGDIELEAQPGTAVTEVEVDARGSDDGAQELLEATRVELREARGGHEVIVHVPKRSGIFRRSVDARIVVRAPEGADVRVDAATADMRARGRFGSFFVQSASGDVDVEAVGELNVKTASGGVRVGDVAGAASLNTASGDMILGRVGGALTVNSASGDVSVREAAADATVSTASGDVRVDALVQGRAKLRSASGDLTAGIVKGSTVWVDARSMSGDTTSELELGDAQPAEEGGPVVELQAMTMSGDITIVRAPAPNEISV